METTEKVKDLPLTERPREKMIRDGASSLSNTELVAILLGSGTRTVPVMRICTELILLVNNDAEKLSELTLGELCKIKGIGELKGLTLLAAFELGKRSQKPGAPLVLKEDSVVKDFIAPYFVGTADLQYYLVLMNARQELLATSEIMVDEGHLPLLKPIIKLCLEAGAASMMICRNDMQLPEKYLSKEKGFVIQLDAAASMLRIRMRGLLII